jgi:hypothetical protein
MTEPDVKRRKCEWRVSYSACSQHDAEKRIQHKFTALFNNAEQIDKLIDISKVMHKTADTKDKVYSRITECIDVEDYPAGNIEPFKEENMTDLAGIILISTIADFREQESKFGIKLRREKAIIAKDRETGGLEEFVVIDIIDVDIDKYILIVEAKRSTIAESLKQCALALKDAYDNNSDGKSIYGFLTTGLSWQLIVYKDQRFSLSEDFKVAFPRMKQDKQRWLKDFSVIVDALYYVLCNSQS